MENKQRWKRASIIRRLSDNTVQSKKSFRPERFEFQVLRERVHKTNRDDSAVANEPILNIGVPENKIDIKFVLMALHEEMVEVGLRVSNHDLPKGTNVVIPSLTGPFDIWFKDNHIYFKRFYFKKLYKIPCVLEGSRIPEEVINVLCALVDYHKLNEIKF